MRSRSAPTDIRHRPLADHPGERGRGTRSGRGCSPCLPGRPCVARRRAAVVVRRRVLRRRIGGPLGGCIDHDNPQTPSKADIPTLVVVACRVLPRAPAPRSQDLSNRSVHRLSSVGRALRNVRLFSPTVIHVHSRGSFRRGTSSSSERPAGEHRTKDRRIDGRRRAQLIQQFGHGRTRCRRSSRGRRRLGRTTPARGGAGRGWESTIRRRGVWPRG